MKENKVSRVLKDQAIWLVFIVLVIAFTIANPRFITMSNLLIMLRQVAVWGIASVSYLVLYLSLLLVLTVSRRRDRLTNNKAEKILKSR